MEFMRVYIPVSNCVHALITQDGDAANLLI